MSGTGEEKRFWMHAGEKDMEVVEEDFEPFFGARIQTRCEKRPGREMSTVLAENCGILGP